MNMVKTAIAAAAAASLFLTGVRADTTEEKTPLGAAMTEVGDSFKVLSRGLRTPDPAQGEKYVKAAKSILENLKEAKDYVPPRIAKLPLAHQPAVLAAYKGLLDKSIKKTESLVSLLQAGDFGAASATVVELKKLRNESHEKFQEEEE